MPEDDGPGTADTIRRQNTSLLKQAATLRKKPTLTKDYISAGGQLSSQLDH